MPLSKVSIRRLPVVTPPIPPSGGRVMTDAGELALVTDGGPVRLVAYLDFLPEAVRRRGNHFHERKTEILYIVKGRLTACYQDVDSGEAMEATLAAGDLVTIAPRCAHVYIPLEYSQAIEVSAEPYEPSDTVPYVLNVTTTPM